MNKIRLKTLLGLSAAAAFLVGVAGCMGTQSLTGSDAAQLSSKTKGSASDSLKPESACGQHENDDKDSLEVKGANDDRDSSDEKDEVEVAGKGCDEGDHHGVQGTHEGSDGDHEGVGDDHESDDDDSLEVAGLHK